MGVFRLPENLRAILLNQIVIWQNSFLAILEGKIREISPMLDLTMVGPPTTLDEVFSLPRIDLWRRPFKVFMFGIMVVIVCI